MFGRATITLDIGPHSSYLFIYLFREHKLNSLSVLFLSRRHLSETRY